MRSYVTESKNTLVVGSGDELPVSGARGELFYLNQQGLYICDGKYWIAIISARGGNITGDLTVASIVTTHLLQGNPTGNANSASKLYLDRKICATGDASWYVDFDGTNDAYGTLTLANTGVKAGTYSSVTVDTKGRVTEGFSPTVKTITSDYVAEPTDEIIICDGSLTLTLTPIKDKKYIIKRINPTGNVSIIGIIDGKSSTSLDEQYQSITIVSNGYVWYLI
jgi:hypothetical protein